MNFREMNKALAAKGVYRYTNNKETLWRKVVCAWSNDDQNSCMPALWKRGFSSILLGFVESVLGRIDRANKVNNQQFKIVIGDG